MRSDVESLDDPTRSQLVTASGGCVDFSRVCHSQWHASRSSRVTLEITVETMATPSYRELSERFESPYPRLKARCVHPTRLSEVRIQDAGSLVYLSEALR